VNLTDLIKQRMLDSGYGRVPRSVFDGVPTITQEALDARHLMAELRREHAARVWQAMQAVCSMAVAYSFGCDDGDECRLWELRWVRPKLDSNATGGGK
jgi:hypothetical protein